MRDAVDDNEAMMAAGGIRTGKALLPGMYSQMMMITRQPKVTTTVFAQAQSAQYSTIWLAEIAPDYALEATAKLYITAKYGKELLYNGPSPEQNHLPVTHANRQR